MKWFLDPRYRQLTKEHRRLRKAKREMWNAVYEYNILLHDGAQNDPEEYARVERLNNRLVRRLQLIEEEIRDIEAEITKLKEQ